MVVQFQYSPTKMPTQIELQPIRIRIFCPIIKISFKYKISENLKVEFSGRTIFFILGFENRLVKSR